MFKHRMQLAQNKRLPQPTHTSITIRKRMDKLKFIMEHTRAHQQMVRTMLQPIKKISHQIRHTLCWRSHVHTSLIRKHAHTALTILPNILYKHLHHANMSTQQVALLESIEMRIHPSHIDLRTNVLYGNGIFLFAIMCISCLIFPPLIKKSFSCLF